MKSGLAEIISVGDEMTSGARLDTNSQWLSRRLEELGIATGWHSTVGDEAERQTEVFRIAAGRAAVVVATGGLGPTADDLTREVLSRLTGQPLVRDDASVRHIEEMFRRYGRAMPPGNLVQADFPAGSRIIPNSHGTAPGIDVEVSRGDGTGCRFFCLPGVPAEMQAMWEQYVRPELAAATGSGTAIIQRVLHCFGAGESQVEAMLPGMISRERYPRVGITASQAVISLRIAAQGPNEADCRELVDADERTIRGCLGTLVFGTGDQTLEGVVIDALRQRNWTLAIADAGLAGGVSSLLAAADPAGEVLRGGIWLGHAATAGPLAGLWVKPAGGRPSHRELSGLAARTAATFECDLGLAVGPVRSEGDAEFLDVALAGRELDREEVFRHSGHPALRMIRSAKNAINLVRLALG